ncbi:unnamed protein product, partial [Phaeothamnion confervicola]
FEVERVIDFVAEGSFRRVAFQLPDGLLREAPEVIWAVQAGLRRRRRRLSPSSKPALEDSSEPHSSAPAVLRPATAAVAMTAIHNNDGDKNVEPLIFVTGDTSYGSCCVDEVAAQHLGADAIVHYGRACLSPTASGVPVLYVFGRAAL